MSRGAKRNNRKRRAEQQWHDEQKAIRTPPTEGESAHSKSYAAGKAVKYNWRIRGPVGKVTTTKVDPTI